MIKVGVAGLGMMGLTHLQVYADRDDVQVVAVADLNPDRLSGKEVAAGNIEGQAQGKSGWSDAKQYADANELIADPEVQLVDICLPTPAHLKMGLAAIRAGKHVMIEKPLARTAAEAFQLAEAAEQAGVIAMPGMCMRFWPGWDWLKRAVDEQRYGKVLSAQFQRLASHPGGPFYSDGDACGGALLDLHVHDTDFIQHCFGVPQRVFTQGYRKVSTEPDHVMSQYLYDDGPMVTAEGGWTMAEGFGFQMRFTVNFEQATAQFDLGEDPTLRLVHNGRSESVDVAAGMGYDYELTYLLNCIQSQTKPTAVTLREAAVSVAIVEAERKSLSLGQPVEVTLP